MFYMHPARLCWPGSRAASARALLVTATTSSMCHAPSDKQEHTLCTKNNIFHQKQAEPAHHMESWVAAAICSHASCIKCMQALALHPCFDGRTVCALIIMQTSKHAQHHNMAIAALPCLSSPETMGSHSPRGQLVKRLSQAKHAALVK